MRKLAPLLLVSLALAACSTSSLTETEQTPVEETTVAFSGEPKQVDETQSVISFVGKSSVVNHEGKFTDYDIQVTLDETEPANLEKAKVTAEMAVAGIVTDAESLNGHLQKADFFAAEANPKITFVSTGIVSKGGNMYTVTGDLTVKGTTKSITFDAEITDDYLTATFDFPRKEFGVGNDSYGDKLLDDTVPVDVKIVFQK